MAQTDGPDQAHVPFVAEAATAPVRGARRFVAWLGTALLVLGALALVWALVTWRAGDPITGLYQRYEQRSLRSAYAQMTERYASRQAHEVNRAAPTRALSTTAALTQLSRLGRAYRAQLAGGDPVGILTVPELGLRTVIVDGTSSSDLKRGPGLDRRSFVPGQGQLAYIAGHRTTYGAPFAHIDALEPGDLVMVELPYAHLTYKVTGHRIVDASALEVLRSRGREHLALQACHPRFFATQRYIADAELVRFALVEKGSRTVYRVRS